MESKLFQTFELSDDVQKTVESGIGALGELRRDTWQRLVDDLPAFLGQKGREAKQRFIDAQLEQLRVGRDVANGIVSLAQMLISAHLEPRTRDDDLDALVRDLLRVAETSDDDETHATVRAFVQRSIEVAPAVRSIRERRQYAQGVLPSLAGFGTTVELRAVLDKEFRLGDNVDAHAPKIMGMIPIASVRLRSDEDEVFAFQCDRDGLQGLVDRLRATLIELDLLTVGASR